MPTGNASNNHWEVRRYGEVNTYNGLTGVDTLSFERLPRSYFNITQAADGSIAVDSVSGASALYKLKLTEMEVLQFNNGRETVDLRTLFSAPKPPTVPSVPSTLEGTAGNDRLQGTAAAEILQGREGHDTLWGNGGNDTLIGGAGTDTIVFQGTLGALVSVGANSTGLVVQTARETVELREFERAQFSDALVVLDTQAGSSVWQAATAYHALHGQMPDTAALSRWTAAADQLSSMGELAQQMLTAYLPEATHLAVIERLFTGFVHRPPSEAELASLADLIGPGRVFPDQATAVVTLAQWASETVVGLLGGIQVLDPAFF
ncbi:MAG: calcium-binding protein [Burkholderiaceae bacterium]|nr:calcium-binding protein [Burkholderiaceae bacterium]